MPVSAAEIAATASNLTTFGLLEWLVVDRDGQPKVGGCSTAISIIL
jgi:hypothetical protein